MNDGRLIDSKVSTHGWTRVMKNVARNFYKTVLCGPRKAKMLPFTSEIFGPPRNMARTPEYCARMGFLWKEVYPAHLNRIEPPDCINYPAQRMLEHVPSVIPACGVAVLKNARVMMDQGWVIGPSDTFLPDHSWFAPVPEKCPVYQTLRLKPDRHLHGVTLLLMSDFANVNYGHVLHDSFPRLHLFEQAATHRIDEVDWVITPKLSSEGKRGLFALLGIDRAKVLTREDANILSCETLIAPDFPGIRRNSPSWVAAFWRSKTGSVDRAKTRRLFVARRNTSREISNEREVIAVLEEFGFEVLNPQMSKAYPAFQEAQIIVGAHGAAMADCLFCQDGAAMVELTPADHIFPYDYTIARAARMRYSSILGTSDPNSTKKDFIIDTTLLKRTVSELLTSQ